MVTALLSAFEVTVTSTAMPTIVRDLNIGNSYEWIVNAFLLTSTAFQPIFGQLADIYGRRWLTIIAVAIFVFGSGISGGASNGNMLIAGRAIQGLGSGGLNMLIDLILCDLVPLRERGKFMGMIFGVFAIGTSLGPFIGGSLAQHSTWRWGFYINLPVGGVALVLLYTFLHVKHTKATLKERMARIDFIGNTLLIASTVAILFALTYAGTKYDWSSWHIIVPLVLGLVGMITFHTYEASRFCQAPTIPPHLFTNRTSSIAFFLTFIHALLLVWALYFLPVYFQAVLGSTPTRSGVQLLPTVLTMLPAAILGGAFLTKIGKYRPMHFAGLTLLTAGLAAFTALDSHSSTAVWVILQMIESAGGGRHRCNASPCGSSRPH
jgi:MFS family permease